MARHGKRSTRRSVHRKRRQTRGEEAEGGLACAHNNNCPGSQTCTCTNALTGNWECC